MQADRASDECLLYADEVSSLFKGHPSRGLERLPSSANRTPSIERLLKPSGNRPIKVFAKLQDLGSRA